MGSLFDDRRVTPTFPVVNLLSEKVPRTGTDTSTLTNVTSTDPDGETERAYVVGPLRRSDEWFPPAPCVADNRGTVKYVLS